MVEPITASSFFISGAARFKDLLYLIAKDRGLAEKDIEHSRFLAIDRSEFYHNGDRNWSAVAICVVGKPAQKMIAIGENGNVFVYADGKALDELIEPRPIMLRGIGVIDGFPVVCGMKRQVYMRVNEKSWVSMHATSPAQEENAGFEAIAGFTTNEMYAVGWNGEIWQWNGTTWLNCVSPTNLIMTGVCCADDGNVYICGQHGILIRGRHDSWEIIELDEMNEDFWDICWFDSKLYLATMTMLYVFSDNKLMPVDFGLKRPNSCYRLSQAEGVLWSIGSDDIFKFDGTQWTSIDC